MVPKQFKFSRNKNKNNLWLRVLHFRLKECEHSALGIFEVKFCFSFIYSKILTQFKTFFIFFLQQKTGLTVKYANKTCLENKNNEITFSDLTFWRLGFKIFGDGEKLVVRMLRTWVKNPRWRPLADYDNQLIRSGNVKWVNWPQNKPV